MIQAELVISASDKNAAITGKGSPAHQPKTTDIFICLGLKPHFSNGLITMHTSLSKVIRSVDMFDMRTEIRVITAIDRQKIVPVHTIVTKGISPCVI